MYTKEVDPINEKTHTVLVGLHKLCLAADELPDFKRGYWWIVYEDVHRYKPIAFCGMTAVPTWHNTGYLCRSGVLPEFRGKGIQKKLIQTRINKAKSLGWKMLITDTRDNLPSSNSLISKGFKLYRPQKPWSWPEALYWMRSI